MNNKGRTLVIFDIDATLADATKRFADAGAEPPRENESEYTEWLGRLQNVTSLSEDSAVGGMSNLVRSIWAGGGALAYVTSRAEQYREVTLSWLVDNGFPLAGPLFMRQEGNWGSVRSVKEPWIQYQQRVMQVSSVIVVDDDPNGDVALMCQENNWTLLKAVSGGAHPQGATK